MSFELPDLAKVAAVFGTLGVVATAEGQPWVESKRTSCATGYWTDAVLMESNPASVFSQQSSSVGSRLESCSQALLDQTVTLRNFTLISGTAIVSAFGFTDFYSDLPAGLPAEFTSVHMTCATQLLGYGLEPIARSQSLARSNAQVTLVLDRPSRVQLNAESRLGTFDCCSLVSTVSFPVASVSTALTRLGSPDDPLWREQHSWSGTQTASSFVNVLLPAGRYLLDGRVVVDWDHGGEGQMDAQASVSTSVCVRSNCLADIATIGGVRWPDRLLTADDLIVYLSSYFQASSSALNLADVAGVGGRLGGDGRITADDLIAYLQLFIQGCD